MKEKKEQETRLIGDSRCSALFVASLGTLLVQNELIWRGAKRRDTKVVGNERNHKFRARGLDGEEKESSSKKKNKRSDIREEVSSC